MYHRIKSKEALYVFINTLVQKRCLMINTNIVEQKTCSEWLSFWHKTWEANQLYTDIFLWTFDSKKAAIWIPKYADTNIS